MSREPRTLGSRQPCKTRDPAWQQKLQVPHAMGGVQGRLCSWGRKCRGETSVTEGACSRRNCALCGLREPVAHTDAAPQDSPGLKDGRVLFLLWQVCVQDDHISLLGENRIQNCVQVPQIVVLGLYMCYLGSWRVNMIWPQESPQLPCTPKCHLSPTFSSRDNIAPFSHCLL